MIANASDLNPRAWADADALTRLFGGSPFAVEQKLEARKDGANPRVYSVEKRLELLEAGYTVRGIYPGSVPFAATRQRIAQHFACVGPPLSFACGPWDGETGHVAIIDVDAHFQERLEPLASIIRSEGHLDSSFFTDGSAEDGSHGKLLIFFERPQHRDALNAYAEHVRDRAMREGERLGLWPSRREKIDIRPFRADVDADGRPTTKPGLIRILGRNEARGGKPERAWNAADRAVSLSEIVPSAMMLEMPVARRVAPPVQQRRIIRPEAKPAATAGLHRTVEAAREHGLADEMQGHRELRSFMLHVAREALRLYGDTPKARARYFVWWREIHSATPWATPSFRSPTSKTKGDPLRPKVLEGTWHAARRWVANQANGDGSAPHGTLLSSASLEGKTRAVSCSDLLAADGNEAGSEPTLLASNLGENPSHHNVPHPLTHRSESPEPLPDGLLLVLEAVAEQARATGLSPLAFALDYRRLAATAGVSRMTAWRGVQALVARGRLVLHDRGLDKRHLVADDDEPSGRRCGLSAVVGIVPIGMEPETVLSIGTQRHVVRRQKARVNASLLALQREKQIDAAPNVERFDQRRRKSVVVVRHPELAPNIPDGGIVLPFVQRGVPQRGGRWENDHWGYSGRLPRVPYPEQPPEPPDEASP